MVTSHFYHDSYVVDGVRLKVNITVDDFRFVVCNIFVLIRHLVARSHCRIAAHVRIEVAEAATHVSTLARKYISFLAQHLRLKGLYYH